MIQLAGAVARRHPKLAARIKAANLSAGAGLLIERWAATLHGDLELAFDDGYGGADSVGVWTQGRPEVYLKPAVERLQAALPGAAGELFDCLDVMTGFNLLMAPRELFSRLGYVMWYDETDEAKFREAVIDNDGEWDESMRGPDSFIDDLPGITRDMLDAKPARYKPRFMATRCAKQAREQADPWVSRLLQSMSECFRFAAKKHKRVWELPNDGEWEPAVFTYYAAWSREDDMGRWVDDAMQYLWDGGTGTDATLVFRPSDLHRPAEAQLSAWDDVVSCIEGCSAHLVVMDQLFAVLGEADEENES